MDLEQFKKTVSRKKKGLTAFLKKLDDIVPEEINTLVATTDATVWQDIDCTKCANCCKTMTPTYTKTDIKRIATHLRMTPKAMTDRWLYKDEKGDWMNKVQPCQFLVNDMCSIYEVRPQDCAEFPHHNKKPFDAYNDTFTQNLSYCPATFTLIERLKKVVERDYEW
jgi:Fe-S-cluster containining protein